MRLKIVWQGHCIEPELYFDISTEDNLRRRLLKTMRKIRYILSELFTVKKISDGDCPPPDKIGLFHPSAVKCGIVGTILIDSTSALNPCQAKNNEEARHAIVG